METRIPEMLSDAEKREMLEELKDYYNIRSHAELARKMGISPQNAFSWVQRGSFNVELVAVKCPELSGDWLLRREGPMLKADRGRAREAEPARTVGTAQCPELKRLVDALEEEQRHTARAQSQADQCIEIMKELAHAIGNAHGET